MAYVHYEPSALLLASFPVAMREKGRCAGRKEKCKPEKPPECAYQLTASRDEQPTCPQLKGSADQCSPSAKSPDVILLAQEFRIKLTTM